MINSTLLVLHEAAAWSSTSRLMTVSSTSAMPFHHETKQRTVG